MKARVYKNDGVNFTQLLRDDGFLIAEARGTHTLTWMIRHFKIEAEK